MSIINEKIDELMYAIENFRDCFTEFDFSTKNGDSAESLSDIDGLESLAVDGEMDDSILMHFDDFCSKIKKSLYPLEDNLKKSDFDWDNLSDVYYDVSEKYKNYRLLKEQVEDNLTGDQEFSSVKLHDKESLIDLVLEYLESNNLIYPIYDQDETYFLANAEFEKKLND